MRRLMIAAMSSGSGKTVLSCGLLAALKRRGIDAEAFKCGPDYIDPMFHSRVLGVPSRNLDLFLQGEAGVRRTLARQRAGFGLLEGAMGFYDGVGGTDQASAWQVAHLTDTPVLLAVCPKGASLTLAAQIKGMQTFRPDSHLAGLFLTDCKPMLYAHLRPILERETGLPVLGYLPPMEEARLESRHLGLLTAGEIEDFYHRFEAVAQQLEETADLESILALGREVETVPEKSQSQTARVKIAVARDKSFCFYYADNLDALKEAGAELVFFSPLEDSELPEADGLYLGGGYPELYLQQLSENVTMRQQIYRAIQEGMPTLAECGGFLYLQQCLESDQGQQFDLVGALPGRGYSTSRLQRFGYLHLTGDQDSMLFRVGEPVPAHEFHYWDCTENGTDLEAQKPNGKSWRCGYVNSRLYAGFPHLHFGGELPLAERFVEAAQVYQKERQR